MPFTANYSLAVADYDIAYPVAVKQFRNSHSGRTRTVDDYPYGFLIFVDHFQCVDEPREYHNRCAMLIVMHHRYRELSFQTCFYLETARRRNIFQVDAAKCRSNSLNCGYYFIGILSGEHNRETIDVGKTFEEHSFAFHDGQCRFGTDVAESKHRRAV